MQSDFNIQYWNYLFESFKGGPDWISEKPLAMAAILRWRIAILEEQRLWRCRTEELQSAYDKAMEEYKSIRQLELFFKPKPGRYFVLFQHHE